MDIKKIKHNIYLKKEIFLGNVLYLFSKKKSKKIKIVSTEKWAYKSGEDILILKEVKRRGYDVEIVCYEKEEVSSDNIYLIKSIWGYQDNQKTFNKFLYDLEETGAKVINPLGIIRNNLNKEEQYKLFINYNIPHINSFFVLKDKNFTGNVKKVLKNNFTGKIAVVKPCISASGNNTYVLNGTDIKGIKLSELEEKFSFLEPQNKLIVQEYISEVKDGEISVVCLNGKIIYAVKRFPSVFTRKNTVTLMDSIEPQVKEITEAILKIPELKNAFYARIDLIKKENSYLVMEIEFTDPQLFLNVGCSKKEVREHIKCYGEELVKYIEKNS